MAEIFLPLVLGDESLHLAKTFLFFLFSVETFSANVLLFLSTRLWYRRRFSFLYLSLSGETPFSLPFSKMILFNTCILYSLPRRTNKTVFYENRSLSAKKNMEESFADSPCRDWSFYQEVSAKKEEGFFSSLPFRIWFHLITFSH